MKVGKLQPYPKFLNFFFLNFNWEMVHVWNFHKISINMLVNVILFFFNRETRSLILIILIFLKWESIFGSQSIFALSFVDYVRGRSLPPVVPSKQIIECDFYWWWCEFGCYYLWFWLFYHDDYGKSHKFFVRLSWTYQLKQFLSIETSPKLYLFWWKQISLLFEIN